LVTIASEDSFYILRFDRDAYAAKIEEGADIGDEGIEEAFDLVAEVSDRFVLIILSGNETEYFLASKPPNGSEIA
jgi:hypothetical protein